MPENKKTAKPTRSITYAAFLRGIMPTNPNMRNEKLRGVFESLGFSNVQTVISSGNVIFECDAKDSVKNAAKNVAELETTIEKALTAKLGINSTTILRNKSELEKLVASDPFKGKDHGAKSYLIITFFKKSKSDKKTPAEIATVIDLSNSRTPEFMRDLEKKHGKEITTRTWKTVGRILAKM